MSNYLASRTTSITSHCVAFFACVLVAIFAACLTTATAQANTALGYVGQFNGSATEAGSFSYPEGVAVNQTTGNVYVVDNEHGVIDIFDSSGTYLSQFNGSATPEGQGSFYPGAIAVDPTDGDVYVVNSNGSIDEFTETGGYISEFNGSGSPEEGNFYPSGVAVDPSSGDIYVVNGGNGSVDEFSSAGAYISEFTGSGSNQLYAPSGVTVTASGNVYVVELNPTTEIGQVEEFNPQGDFVTVIDDNGSQGVAVDPGTNDIYVGDANPDTGAFSLVEYNGSGEVIAHAGLSEVSSTTGGGIAVGDAVDKIYVSDLEGNYVAICGQVPLPSATTEGATEVQQTNATVSGTIDPDSANLPAAYHFEYGATETYGTSLPVPNADVGSGTTSVIVTAKLTGLQPLTTYHYRLVATNESGETYGEDKTVTTLPLSPTVNTDPAGSITSTSAITYGTVNPHGAETSYYIQYGTTAAYASGLPVPPGEAGDETTAQLVSANLLGLQPDTTYHYRVVATNSGGITYGPDQEFTTAIQAPVAATGQAMSVTQTTATLTGTINPEGASTSYRFEYGKTGYYGASVPASEGGAGAFVGTETVIAILEGLEPNTTYYFRLVASSDGGNTYGEARTVTTLPSPLTVGSTALPNGGSLTPATKDAVGNVKVVKHAVKGTTITLTVEAPAKGKLSVSGAGLKKVSKAVTGKATYKLNVTLTKAEAKKLKAKKKKLTLKIKVAFSPASGTSSSASVKVKLKS